MCLTYEMKIIMVTPQRVTLKSIEDNAWLIICTLYLSVLMILLFLHLISSWPLNFFYYVIISHSQVENNLKNLDSDVWVMSVNFVWAWSSTSEHFSETKCYLYSCVRLFSTPQTVARQAPLSMGFPRQVFWSGQPFPSLGDLPNPGTESGSPALQADSLLSEPPGKPLNILMHHISLQWYNAIILFHRGDITLFKMLSYESTHSHPMK